MAKLRPRSPWCESEARISYAVVLWWRFDVPNHLNVLAWNQNASWGCGVLGMMECMIGRYL